MGSAHDAAGLPGKRSGGVAPRGTVALEGSGTHVAPPGPVQSGHRQDTDRGRHGAKEAAAYGPASYVPSSGVLPARRILIMPIKRCNYHL